MHTKWRPDLAQYEGPKYLALTRALREAIRDGHLPPDAQLPTVRDLAWDLKITPGTVARAYHLATQEGLLSAVVGRGTFVAAAMPRLGPQKALYTKREGSATSGPIDLRPPLLPDVGQSQAFAAAMQAVAANRALDWLDYATQVSEAPLRTAVADWAAERDLGPYGPEEIALTNGGQNALLAVMLCCLRGERPVVLVEELGYAGFRYAARLARADVVPIELDDEGMVPEALEAACKRHGPQLLCLTPEAQNPTTARMGPERREKIIAIARAYDLQIIEDGCYVANRLNVATLRALAPERVWYVGSFSKSLSAALRFGYVVCPTGMGEAGRLTVQHSCFALAMPISEMVLHLLQSGEAARLRGLVQRETEARVLRLAQHLGPFGLQWQPGLLITWLPLPSGWRASNFTREAAAGGVLVRPADEFALVHGRAPNAVRIAIAGHLPLERLDQACAVLAGLLARPSFEVAV
ncbi:MAG: PLP-dependent aminotransferase family protein [Rhodobacteraceae bacterium]|nr:PLP-dependent aminotransferase family protein [Paracoccaceae bacterium]